MRKRISLKTRRPDLSRERFREYYEQRHVPLGLTYMEHFGWLRYVRNHLVDSGQPAVTFDCITEFWVADDSDDEALYRFLRSPGFRTLDQDDRNFLDISRRCSFEVRETVIRDGEADANDGALQKVMLLWSSAHHGRETGALARRILEEIGEAVVHATLDNVCGQTPPALPFDTLLSLYLSGDAAIPDRTRRRDHGELIYLRVDPVETPRSLLMQAAAQ